MAWATSTGRSVPYPLQQACFKRDHWTCLRCGYQGTPNAGDLNADHITPRAEGGQDVLSNLETLCRPCHAPKSQAEAVRGRQRRNPKRRPPVHPADALSA
jgi:5-methylcytosine-specific restriction protein A